MLVLQRIIDQHHGKVKGDSSLELPLYCSPRNEILEMNFVDKIEDDLRSRSFEMTGELAPYGEVAHVDREINKAFKNDVNPSDYDIDMDHVCAICVGHCDCYYSFFLRKDSKNYNYSGHSKSPRLTPYLSLENKSTVLHGHDVGCHPCSSDHNQNNLNACSSDTDAGKNRTDQDWIICMNGDIEDFERKRTENSNEDETIAVNAETSTHQLMQDPVRAQDFESLLYAPAFLKSLSTWLTTVISMNRLGLSL